MQGHEEGTTPIHDSSGLIPSHITMKSELDRWEARNILEATKKHLSGRRVRRITIEWLKRLHFDMFDRTWDWAGKFRVTDLTIGVRPELIQEQVKQLTDDIEFWGKLENGPDILEQSVRLHHRLAFIHPFPNGNGRHARLASDIFLYAHRHPLPEWPGKEAIDSGGQRKKYLEALRLADKGEFAPLLEFTRKFLPRA